MKSLSKHSVYLNFILGYFFIIFFSTVFIYYVVTPRLIDIRTSEFAKDLYKQAYTLSNSYSSSHYEIETDNYDYTRDIQILSYTTDTTIWLTDMDGRIRYSSNYIYVGENIKDFSSYFDTDSYVIGNCNGLFKRDFISIVVPIVNTYKTYGYVIVNRDYSNVTAEVDNIVYYIYLSTFIVIFTSLILMLLFHFHVRKPLMKITKAAKEYAKGNLDYDGLKINSKDEIGELAEYLNVMSEEFKNLDERQKKFIANVSHDFRSPLTSIKGYLEAMLDGTIPPEMSEKYIRIVLSETERLTKLTSSLLTLNTWNSNGSSLDIQEFDCVRMVRHTLLTFEGQCNKKKISFDVTLGAKSYMVMADQTKIQQVVYNLIDNAIKFSNSNSKIYVTVKDVNDKVFISIKDTGMGIPKDSINKIWDRFYKSDSSRGKDKAGTGLGLAIVKEVITNHNENINVVSTEGVGTEFTFSLTKSKKGLLS